MVITLASITGIFCELYALARIVVPADPFAAESLAHGL
jgi:hypothetical protein